MKKNRTMIALALAAALVIILGGRALEGNEATPPLSVNTGDNAGSISDSAEVKEGAIPKEDSKMAPDFTLKTLEGETITLSEYRGKKPVVLDFWASWCPNCRRDMPILSGLYEKYGDEVEVIGVNLAEPIEDVRSYIDSAGIIFPTVLDPDQEAANAYSVRYTNYHVLIDTDGAIFRLVPGDISESDVTDLIAAP